MEQVDGGSKKGTHKRQASGGRVFHDLDSLQPDPNHLQTQQGGLVEDSRLRQAVSRCQDSIMLNKFSSKTIRLTGGMVGVVMMIFFLTRFV